MPDHGQIELSLATVMAAARGTLTRAGAEQFTSVGIDSRTVRPGMLFFCVKGERFDGHEFAAAAVSAGATGVVASRARAAQIAAAVGASACVIAVDDPIAALGRVAAAHRKSFPELRVIGVAGSNGKTTTKEITAQIFARFAGPERVLKTEGNLNNHFGVPLTLLRLRSEHRFAVIEMGMSGLGELAYLAELARPDVAIIVSIGVEHLEQLGSLENIARAEAEILDAVAERGFAVIPAVEPLLSALVEKVPPARRLTFGETDAHVAAGVEKVAPGPEGLTFQLFLRGLTSRSGVTARLPLLGAHNAYNAAAAAAAAAALGVSEAAILDGLAHVKPAKHRGELMKVAGRVVLDDCYNASPVSMRAALDAVGPVAAGRKRIAVLGDMLELGPSSPSLHAEVGAYAAERIDALVAFGPLSRHLAGAARERLGADRVLETEDPVQAAARAAAWSSPGDVILVKGSRGMRLERVIDALGAQAERS